MAPFESRETLEPTAYDRDSPVSASSFEALLVVVVLATTVAEVPAVLTSTTLHLVVVSSYIFT